MIPTYVQPYRHGELRIGWASWDNGTFSHRSIKWAYQDASGKISRGSPEIPFDILIDMVDLAYQHNEISPHLPPPSGIVHDVTKLTKSQLVEERKVIAAHLGSVQRLIAALPWVDWEKAYNAIGARYEAVKAEINLRP